MGPRTEAADQIHQTKYRAERETFRDAVNRVAKGLKDDDNHYHALREILADQRFLPGGRIQAAIGADKYVTAHNCFVSGEIADSFTDGEGSIMQRAHEAAATMRMGGGIGYDFSTLRPRGALIKKLMSHSTGPISFMKIFNEICLCTASSGHRRGAQMGVLRCDHPDINEVVNAKHDNTTLTGFNISVAVTDEFMEAVKNGTTFKLRFGGEVYREVEAADLWESIMRSAWDFAEPGVLFVDTINRMNNLWYCETISTTNPCAEIPIPPFGSCLLGSINLVKYLNRQPVSVQDMQFGKASPYSIDIDRIKADLEHIVPAMDNVVDRAKYPLPEQMGEAKNKRRMGIGVTGLANALEACGLPYGSPQFLAKEAEVLYNVNKTCYVISARIASKKGPFPLFDADLYLQSKFIQSDALDDETRDLIKKHGIRNSHLTAIAPTGTISLTADNVSSGIEPVFSYEIPRPINTPEGQKIITVYDYGVEFLGVKGKTASEVPVQDHLAVAYTAQKYCDAAVSKTCNLDGSTPWQDFKDLYRTAYDAGSKGMSVFNIHGKRMALLTATKDSDEDQGQSCTIDPETGRRDCA